MNFFYKILTMIGRVIINNPSTAASVTVFTLGFAIISGNAIYGQDVQHTASLQHSQKAVKTAVKSIKVTKVSFTENPSTLTTLDSLTNIPVPTSSPIRKRSGAIHSSLVREVQSALAGIGLYEGKVDGIYGSATRESIIAYQERAGILPDGEASYGLLTNVKSALAISDLRSTSENSNASYVKPERVKQPSLMVFDTDTVAKIQTGLRENFAEEAISVDGLIGQQTRSAIQRFQARFKLQASGELNEETVQKLVSLGIINSI